MAGQLTSKQYFFQLNLIYGAQAIFMLIFGAVAFVMSQSAQPSEGPVDSLLLFVLGVIVVASLSGAHFTYNILVQRIDKDISLKTKLQKYLTAVLARSALLEFPALFASVVCILAGSQLPLITVLFVLIVFYMLRPSAAQIIRELNLSQAERGMLEDPQSTFGE